MSDIPEFPVRLPTEPHPGITEQWPGLSRRELFAAIALHGVLSDWGRNGAYDKYAIAAVNYADALIAALDRSKT